MSLILLEALGAGALLVLIVWWTMFSGRDGGEPQRDPAEAPTPPSPASGAGTGERGEPKPGDPSL